MRRVAKHRPPSTPKPVVRPDVSVDPDTWCIDAECLQAHQQLKLCQSHDPCSSFKYENGAWMNIYDLTTVPQKNVTQTTRSQNPTVRRKMDVVANVHRHEKCLGGQQVLYQVEKKIYFFVTFAIDGTSLRRATSFGCFTHCFLRVPFCFSRFVP